MIRANFSIIDPNEANIPEAALVQKLLSDLDRLPTEEHDKAVRAFCVSDAIASGISNDLAFVDKIPAFVKEIIDNKLWECLYVAKGVTLAIQISIQYCTLHNINKNKQHLEEQ